MTKIYLCDRLYTSLFSTLRQIELNTAWNKVPHWAKLAKILWSSFQKNGTFVEAGANDGDTELNTLALETLHGWSGLLIEPVPWLFERIVTPGRLTLFLEGCQSPKKFPFIVSLIPKQKSNQFRCFLSNSCWGPLFDSHDYSKNWVERQKNCHQF